MEPLYVRVDFTDGAQRIYAIFGRMPVVDFRCEVAKRHAAPIRNVTFLHDEADMPVVAELLPLE